MSDKLETCVCGGEAKRAFHNTMGTKIFVSAYCPKCKLATGIKSGQEKAISQWNTMQRALKDGWSSEVPTEEGIYLFDGIVNPKRPIHRLCDDFSPYPIISVRDGHVVVLDGAKYGPTQLPIEMLDGLWFLIHYPDPPKE